MLSLSVVGEEYVAYSESVKGQFSPLVAIQKYDGTIAYRELVKEDLLRIHDDLVVPGGWVFRKSFNTSSSWVKRFALVRGSFMYFFHSPQNEKPIAVVPLEDCRVTAPEQAHKTFDEMRTYKANEGYEFEIQHNSRPTVRLYCVGETERLDWLASLREHVAAAAVVRQLAGDTGGDTADTGGSAYSGDSGLVVTCVKLTGLSLQPTSGSMGVVPAPGTPGTPGRAGAVTTTALSTPSLLPLSTGLIPAGHLQLQEQGNQGSSSNPFLRGSNTHTHTHTGQGSVSVSYKPPVYAYAYEQAHTHTAPGGPGGVGGAGGAVGAGGVGGTGRPFISKYRGLKLPCATNLHKKLGFEVLLIEENLKKKLSDQLEARGREGDARESLYAKDAVEAAQVAEAKNPLFLSKLFRQMLAFVDEEVAEDAQPGTPLQMPHVKGAPIEDMMITVYQVILCYMSYVVCRMSYVFLCLFNTIILSFNAFFIPLNCLLMPFSYLPAVLLS
jgi:hypothetical protein